MTRVSTPVSYTHLSQIGFEHWGRSVIQARPRHVSVGSPTTAVGGTPQLATALVEGTGHGPPQAVPVALGQRSRPQGG